MIVITSDWSDIDDELDRLGRMPTYETTRLLDAALDFSFGLTQAAVHRVTGALAASGKVSTGKSRMEHEWSGEITYGEGGGVDYAWYEMRRGVHWVGKTAARGDHDFFRPLLAVGPVFEAAMLAGLS